MIILPISDYDIIINRNNLLINEFNKIVHLSYFDNSIRIIIILNKINSIIDNISLNIYFKEYNAANNIQASNIFHPSYILLFQLCYGVKCQNSILNFLVKDIYSIYH